MAKKYTIIVEKDEQGWLVSEVLGLPGCHTQARDMSELLRRTKEAIKAYLKEEGDQKNSGEFVGVQQIEV
jgi:predicted RNase H-like HicB family nuclease